MSALLALAAAIAGFLAAGAALYSATGERRNRRRQARERSLHFCGELADICDWIIASPHYPTYRSQPPINASLLSYLQYELRDDLQEQYVVWTRLEGHTMASSNDLHITICRLCGELYANWEV